MGFGFGLGRGRKKEDEEERELDGEDQDGMLVEMLDDKRMSEETLNEEAVLEKVQ